MIVNRYDAPKEDRLVFSKNCYHCAIALLFCTPLTAVAGSKTGIYLGAGVWNSDVKAGSLKDSDSGTDPIYGAGVRLTLFAITGRLEFEYFDQSDVDNLYMTSFSLMYTF